MMRMNADFQLLSGRTFHPDEANQAFTTGRLLETGRYEYRPDDHHGPTLYYAAAALQKASGHNTLAAMDGSLLRCTPLLFAVLALVFGFLAVRKLVKPAAGTLGGWLVPSLFVLLLGTSPIFVFFATDFIQEMLLACFTMAMFWAGVGYFHSRAANGEQRAARIKPGTWALLFGISAGLAFATKETSLIAFASAAVAGLVLKFNLKVFKGSKILNHVILAGLAFLLTAVLLYSSFASNWQGVYNAFVAAPLSYLGRAAGSAASAGAADHVHPWWQYLYWLFADEYGVLAFFILCGTGMGLFARFAWLNIRPDVHVRAYPALLRAFLFTLGYAMLLLVFYSLIPYKTPWCALQIHVALMLAAILSFAVGSHVFTTVNSLPPPPGCSAEWSACIIWLKERPRLLKTISIMPLAIIAILMLWANGRQLFRMARDPDSKEIPYNYASASPEVKQLASTVASAMDVAANREPRTASHEPPFVAVALPPADTWPFPWYNRPYEPHTGYWTSFDDLKRLAEGGAKPTVVIVPMTEGHLVQPLFPHLKNTKRFYMRPGVRVRVFW